jgi:hypothetical protein
VTCAATCRASTSTTTTSARLWALLCITTESWQILGFNALSVHSCTNSARLDWTATLIPAGIAPCSTSRTRLTAYADCPRLARRIKKSRYGDGAGCQDRRSTTAPDLKRYALHDAKVLELHDEQVWRQAHGVFLYNHLCAWCVRRDKHLAPRRRDRAFVSVQHSVL